MAEEKDIPGYAGYYKISTSGKITALPIAYKFGYESKSVKIKPEITLSTSFMKSGYERVCLSKNGIRKSYLVHRLIALAFIPTVKGKDFINHKDGNKKNNTIENLEWCNRSENIIHAIKTGLKVSHKGQYGPNPTPVSVFDLFGNKIKDFGSISDASEGLKIPKQNISLVVRGVWAQTKGYVFYSLLNKSL